MPERAVEQSDKVLILCIDTDNDIGKKTKIQTPIIGRKQNIDAATKLLLTDPEEADGNTMFEGVRLYDDINTKTEPRGSYEIATIAGSELGGLTADRKIAAELASILKDFSAEGIILVTDGFSDERIIPIIQSRAPIISVRRVVVKHSKSIEETAAVFSRYVRMLFENPKYSKLFLGPPGILLIAIAGLLVAQQFIPYDITTWIGIVAVIIVGVFLLGRAYGLDKKVLSFQKWLAQIYLHSLPGLIRGFSLVGCLLVIALGFFTAWTFVAEQFYPFPTDLTAILEVLPSIIGVFISESLTMLVIGICILFLGRAIAYLFDHDPRFWRTIVFLVLTGWSWVVFTETSVILRTPLTRMENLIIYIIIGIVLIISSSFITHRLSKKYRKFFRGLTIEEDEEQNEKTEFQEAQNPQNKEKSEQQE